MLMRQEFEMLKKVKDLLSQEDEDNPKAVDDKFSHLAILEKISRRQKSRPLWLKEENKNMKKFHCMTSDYWRKNLILFLMSKQRNVLTMFSKTTHQSFKRGRRGML